MEGEGGDGSRVSEEELKDSCGKREEGTVTEGLCKLRVIFKADVIVGNKQCFSSKYRVGKSNSS